jgi:hypothetical protein
MLFREINSVYSENHMKAINAQKLKCLSVGKMESDCALKD